MSGGLEAYNKPTPEITLACGLLIDLDRAKEIVSKVMMSDAKKIVEVMIKYQGITKEFTFAEFFERLGFYEKKGE